MNCHLNLNFGEAAVLMLAAVLGFTTSAAAEQTPTSAASGFPKPDRPVASIVSPTWGQGVDRDKADEVGQIAARLHLRPGMTVADIGSGDGYDSLRLARVVGPRGEVIAEDIMQTYLDQLRSRAKDQTIRNIAIKLGRPDDPELKADSVDAVIMVHMYHEITQPYALLYNLVPALKPGALVGVEELDRPTQSHGTPPALLACEFAAVGFRQIKIAPLKGGLGYFAVFAPPAPGQRPPPNRIVACRG